MFDNLKKTVSKSNKRARKSGVEIPRTVAFVQELRKNDLRLSYAALADAAEALGEHTATGMSAGQRGAALLAGIPGDLQPSICNASGGYRKGIEWDDAPDADPKALKKLGYVRPEAVQPFVQAFIKATAEPSEEPSTEEQEVEVEPTDES
jgi:hypothetical protein